MKKIEQIRENYDFITEKEEADTRKLVILARAGLFESTKLPMYKRALSKDAASMTIAERKAIVELSEALMSEIISSQDMNLMEASKYNTVADLPNVIVLKRKAVRQYPGQQVVGLYYSQYLDRYVSIPFGPENKIGHPGINEAVDWYKAYDQFRKSNEDDADIAPLKPEHLRDPAKVKSYMLSVARRGKIDPRYMSGGKEGSDEAKVRTASKKYLRSKGVGPVSAAGIMLGQRLRGRILNALDKATGKSSAVSPSIQPSAPKKARPWGEPPTGAGGIPLVKQKSSRKNNPSPEVEVPTTARRMYTPTKNKLGIGDQPSGNFKFSEPANKTKTPAYSSQQAPSGSTQSPGGLGDQPVVDPKEPKAALRRKLTEKRQVNEAGPLAIAAVPVLAAGSLAVGLYHATKHLADPKNQKDIGAALNAGVSGVKNAWSQVSDYASKKLKGVESRRADEIKATEAERSGEATAGAAFDAKKALLKRQRADDRDAAEIASVSGTNTKNIAAPPVAKATESPEKNIAQKMDVAPPVEVKTSAPPAVAKPPQAAAPPSEAEPINRPLAGAIATAAAATRAQTAATSGTRVDAQTMTDSLTRQPGKGKGRKRLGSPDITPFEGNGKELSPGNFTLAPKIVIPGGKILTGFDKEQENNDRKLLGIAEDVSKIKFKGKPLSLGKFTLAPKISKPKGQTTSTGYDKEQENNDRKLLGIAEQVPPARPRSNPTRPPRSASPAPTSAPQPTLDDSDSNERRREIPLFNPDAFTSRTREPPAKPRNDLEVVNSFDGLRPVTTAINSRIAGASRRYSSDLARQQQMQRLQKKTQKESVITTLKSMVEENVSEMQLNISESSIKINTTMAKNVVDVYESLNKDNKKKMEDMLDESVDSFKKILSFSVRQ